MDLLDRLPGHDGWTTRQLLTLADALSDEQLDRQFDIGHQTLRRTFLHIIHNMEVWSALLAGENVDAREAATNASIKAMTARLDAATARLAIVARSIRGRNGWDDRWVDPFDGVEKTFGAGIAHVLTHSIHHRAQLLYMLRRVGVADLPEGDVLSWESQVATAFRAD